MNNDFYKLTMQEGAPARLDLLGVIGGGFWDNGFDESSFAEAMAGIDDARALDIYINSQGGSVFAAIAIYNIIARHKGAVTIHVAGLAASAATIITSVPNGRVIMPSGALMLVHPVRVSANSMTPEELKEASENLEKVRDSVIGIYAKKTRKSRETLLAMMQKESYLTASEAVELGFADEMDASDTVSNVRKGDVVMINGLNVSASLFDAAPKGFLKEAKTMDLETLTKENPGLVESIRAEAYAKGAEDERVKAYAQGTADERARILAIEEIATAGHDDLVTAAKLDGEMTAEKLAVAILKADKARNASMLRARANDAQELASIVPTGNEGLNPAEEKKAKEEAEMQAIIEAGRRGFTKSNKGRA